MKPGLYIQVDHTPSDYSYNKSHFPDIGNRFAFRIPRSKQPHHSLRGVGWHWEMIANGHSGFGRVG